MHDDPLTPEDLAEIADMSHYADRVFEDRRRKLRGPAFTKLMRTVAPWPRIRGMIEQLQISPAEHAWRERIDAQWEAAVQAYHDEEAETKRLAEEFLNPPQSQPTWHHPALDNTDDPYWVFKVFA